MSELLYDSPLTPPSSAEVNKGEYVTLRNTSGIPIPLRYVKLRVPSHGSYSFSSTDTLQPDHSILVAYGTGTDSTDLRLADNLPAGLFSDPAMHLRTQTSMTLPDGGGSLQLYEDVSGFETLLENISFGGSGILAANAHCDTTCQADTARPEVQAVQLIDYTDTYTYDGVPYEAREAKGKGKDGETYYTVKAVTGRKPGSKEYELKEEGAPATDGPLTRVVISDIKHSVIASGVVGSFNADVKVMRDYYAFGMEMPGQIWQAGGYRYGFNGMERDDELKGAGNSYTTDWRQLDVRIGRWMSIDPEKNHSITPYNSMESNPIINIDPLGDKIRIVGAEIGGVYGKPKLGFRLKAQGMLLMARMIGPKDIREKISDLQKDSKTHFIVQSDIVIETGGTEDNFNLREDGVILRDDLEKGESYSEVTRAIFGRNKGNLVMNRYEGTGVGTVAIMRIPLKMPEKIYSADKDINGNVIVPNWGRAYVHELRHMWDWAFGHNTSKQTSNGLQVNEKRATMFENAFVNRMHKLGFWKDQEARIEYSGKTLAPKDRN